MYHDDETEEIIDNRPPPRPRKHPQLWQSYQLWDELMRMRQKHILRISSAERGKSTIDVQFEKDMLEQVGLDDNLELARKIMISYGKQVGPIWGWLGEIKGLKAGGEAAKLLAQIDDIARFDTVSKMWRFAGYAVIEGKAEKNQAGEKSHYNRKLKSICYMIAEQFIRQQTPGYVDIYYAEKAKQRELYPDIYCKQCSDAKYRAERTRAELSEVVEADRYGPGMTVSTLLEQKEHYFVLWDDCPSKKAHIKMLTDAHVHNRAWRKMIKEFLRDVWLQWRRLDGLPVTERYLGVIANTLV